MGAVSPLSVLTTLLTDTCNTGITGVWLGAGIKGILRPPLSMTEPGLAGNQYAEAEGNAFSTPDPELLNASRKDWRDKHISTDINDK